LNQNWIPIVYYENPFIKVHVKLLESDMVKRIGVLYILCPVFQVSDFLILLLQCDLQNLIFPLQYLMLYTSTINLSLKLVQLSPELVSLTQALLFNHQLIRFLQSLQIIELPYFLDYRLLWTIGCKACLQA
jgi:hypothetical protein